MEDISKEKYAMIFGLFTLASKHQRKVDEYETEMNSLLGLHNGSHLSDEIYTVGSHVDFDEALKRAGFQVEK